MLAILNALSKIRGKSSIFFTIAVCFVIPVLGLNALSKIVYGAAIGFFKAQKAEVEGKKQAAQAANLFWQLCERKFQELVNACEDSSGEEVKNIRRVFAGFVNKAYNTYCPKDTARQLDAWAANRPNLAKYLA